MKQHFVISVNQGFQIPGIPYWGDLIRNKAVEAKSFIPGINSIFQKYQLPIWFTSEYKPAAEEWSKAEIINDLDKIYRIILKRNQKIPTGLVNEISLLPYVRDVRKIDVGVADLPVVSASMGFLGLKPGDQIMLPESHRYSKGNPRIKIAVLDTGVDKDHSSIKHAMNPGADFVNIINGSGKFIGDFLDMDEDPDDEVGHGTHVCGILVAKGSKMEEGVVPNCKIIPVRVLGAMKKGNKTVGAGLVDNINNGIKWAVDQGADVINMSLGIKHTGGGLPHEQVIKYALGKGVTIVAASGNDGTHSMYYPGALPGVIAVGAVDANDKITSFSTFGRHVSFVAPGLNIVSSFPGNKFSAASGTSQASPFAAGSIALLKSIALKSGRKLSDRQVKFILKHTSDKQGTSMKDIKTGYGRINLLDAIKLLKFKLNI